MKNQKSILSTLFVSCFGLTSVFAQNAIPATGGDATGANGSASYTVGQVAYTTNAGSNGSSAQGAQQAYEIFTTLGLAEGNAVILEVLAFPNPTTDFLTLTVDGKSVDGLSFQLYDLKGKLIKSNEIKSETTQIVMSELARGNYFISVSNNERTIKSFRIIKN
jgi:hypothetical protein